jgi:hypothetical protein
MTDLGPITLEVPEKTTRPQRKSRTKDQVANLVKRSRLKEFGVITITKSTDIINDQWNFQTYTFNTKVVQEWASRNQISPYLAALFKGPDSANRVINKVNSVQIIDNFDTASAAEGGGAATLTWTDKNGDVSITTTGHVW